MNQDVYERIEYTNNYELFTFVSRGPRGNLVKVVRFTEFLRIKDSFNLSLGTMLPDGRIDFETISNNGDRNKILTTVALIIGIFMEKHPGKLVYVEGSDKRRTLLYQRAIAYGYEYLKEIFVVYGDLSSGYEESEFEPFTTKKNYTGFLIARISSIE